jgi:ABC-type sugar transport system ATPase subunit
MTAPTDGSTPAAHDGSPRRPLLAVTGVGKRFGGLQALSDVSLSIDRGTSTD